MRCRSISGSGWSRKPIKPKERTIRRKHASVALDQWRTLADAQPTDDAKNAQHTRLGPVGGRIVGEVLIGLMLGDNDSFLSMEPNWKPLFGHQNVAGVFGRFTLGDLIQVVPAI